MAAEIQITFVLFQPKSGDALGLLKSGICGDKPPLVYEVSGTWTNVPQELAPVAIPLVWNSVVIPEGFDRLIGKYNRTIDPCYVPYWAIRPRSWCVVDEALGLAIQFAKRFSGTVIVQTMQKGCAPICVRTAY